MASNRTVACIIGTRPEVVKMASIIRRLRQAGSGFAVRILSTGQHRELLDRALADFALKADADLALMRPGQSLADLTARALVALNGWLDQERPDLVLAQGDTTTVFCAALACQYLRIPFAHVEAGLRTGDRSAPFPEETNRVLAGHLADLHFAPTPTARAHLLREGIDPSTVHVVGNPVIDALLWTARRAVPSPVQPGTDHCLLVTTHRRESVGLPLQRICQALTALIDRHPNLSVVLPVHPNPQVRHLISARLGGRDRVHLIDPLGYPEFVALMRHATLILTDSGGVQEEAPALGKPVLVLRDVTERPEAVASGSVQLVGTDVDRILSSVNAILAAPERPHPRHSPYGDGFAADRIARILALRFGLDPGPNLLPPWPDSRTRSHPAHRSSNRGLKPPLVGVGNPTS